MKPDPKINQKHLTKAGWPRPIVDGWSIPWVSPSNQLAAMDGTRVASIYAENRCQVCGVPHPPGATVFLCVAMVTGMDKPAPMPAGVVAFAMDHGILHERCARLAVGRCPRLREIRTEGRLVVLSANVDDVFCTPDPKTDVDVMAIAADRATLTNMGDPA
jgi:hypothetical protein